MLSDWTNDCDWQSFEAGGGGGVLSELRDLDLVIMLDSNSDPSDLSITTKVILEELFTMQDFWTWSLLLASLTLSYGVALSSGEDYFYLALRSNDTGLDMDECERRWDTTGTSECSVLSEKKIECSCGDPLLESISRYQAEIGNSTCSSFKELDDPSSKFSFCTHALRALGCGYEIYPVMLNRSVNISGVDIFTESSLKDKIEEIEDRLRVFKRVLDRTIIGVLIEAQFSKCACFVSFTTVKRVWSVL